MPRKNANEYRVVGAELLTSEVAMFDLIAQQKGLKRPVLIKRVLRDFLVSQAVKPSAKPVPNGEQQ